MPCPAEKTNHCRKKLGEFAFLYEFAQLFAVFQCDPLGRGQAPPLRCYLDLLQRFLYFATAPARFEDSDQWLEECGVRREEIDAVGEGLAPPVDYAKRSLLP